MSDKVQFGGALMNIRPLAIAIGIFVAFTASLGASMAQSVPPAAGEAPTLQKLSWLVPPTGRQAPSVQRDIILASTREKNACIDVCNSDKSEYSKCYIAAKTVAEKYACDPKYDACRTACDKYVCDPADRDAKVVQSCAKYSDIQKSLKESAARSLKERLEKERDRIEKERGAKYGTKTVSKILCVEMCWSEIGPYGQCKKTPKGKIKDGCLPEFEKCKIQCDKIACDAADKSKEPLCGTLKQVTPAKAEEATKKAKK
jgi:hypothetical protein